MLSLRLIVIPIGVACNLHCKYCLRDNGKTRVEGFNDMMREFFVTLNPQKTEMVIFSGGEPLLYWKKLKEAIEYIPENIQIRITSNGTLLTDEMVEYINKRNILFALSWDGKKATEFLRGVDVLKDPILVERFKRIHWLNILSVITNRNPDVFEIYKDIKEIFGEKTVGYRYGVITRTPFNSWLLDNFDTVKFLTSLREYRKNVPWAHIETKNYARERNEGLNILPNGDVVSNTDITHKYGTIENTLEEILEAKRLMGDYSKCLNDKCIVADRCELQSQFADPLRCELYRLDWFMRMQNRV